MSWSYSGNPADSALDKVRFLIGDTDTTDQLLTNEEINYTIAESGGSIYQSAHDAAYAIASKFVERVFTPLPTRCFFWVLGGSLLLRG